ncbi:MAG: heparinase II/III family protein [Bacteroidia bacterium]
MLKKFKRYFFTILHIHPVQAVYQVWYRIKRPWVKLSSYSGLLKHSIQFFPLPLTRSLIVADGKYSGKNQFTFIGITHTFEYNVDWKHAGPGKLWNYNLQYFDFLLDNSISVDERLRLLTDFNAALLSGLVKPEPYPVSLRILNTLLFISEHQIRNEEIEEGLKRQLDYLDHNLEYHLLANHLLENCFSAYILSSALQHESLQKKYKKLLRQQLRIQLLKDGAHYECSPMYHSIILSKVLLCIEAASSGNDPDFTQFLKKEAELMLGWITQFAFPDGSWALMNDAAENIAPETARLKKVATDLRLELKLVPMKESGFRKLKGDQWECIIKTGNIIPSYQPGHTHSDMLSFCLWHARFGQVIVDPGISTYNNTLQRQIERGTPSHNTVSINRQNQSDVWGAFRIGKRGVCRLIKDVKNELTAEVKSWTSKRLRHIRTFSCTSNTLSIHDIVNNTQQPFQSTILFNSNFVYTFETGELKNEALTMQVEPSGEIEPATHACRYNQLLETTRLTITSPEPHTLKFSFK